MKAIALLLGVMLGLTVSAQTNSQNKMKE
ncbi:MAG: hypothetical protein UZ12_BCD005000425, partial [Bacteroidetes bacterium OLB12]